MTASISSFRCSCYSVTLVGTGSQVQFLVAVGGWHAKTCKGACSWRFVCSTKGWNAYRLLKNFKIKKHGFKTPILETYFRNIVVVKKILDELSAVLLSPLSRYQNALWNCRCAPSRSHVKELEFFSVLGISFQFSWRPLALVCSLLLLCLDNKCIVMILSGGIG